jgi:dTMP kinase
VNDQGRLIVFEGPDGVGKTTIARAVARRLRKAGAGKGEVLELAFPAGAEGSLGRVVYDLHHDHERFGLTRPMDRTSLQLLHIAAHIDTIENWIRPHVDAGGWVVLDRFWWSTWAYGMANEAPVESLETMIHLERIHWRDLAPDLLIVIDRDTPFRVESDAAYFNQLRELYERLEADETRVPVRHYDNNRTFDDAVNWCMQQIAALDAPDQAPMTEQNR